MARFFAAVAALIPFAVLLVPTAAQAKVQHTPPERKMINAINDVRTANGRAPVRSYRPLLRAARSHCRDMTRARFFDHTSSDGSSFRKRISRYVNKRIIGENLAALPQRRGGEKMIVDLWMDSPSHRTVLLDRSFRLVGVARCRGQLGNGPESAIAADFASAR